MKQFENKIISSRDFSLHENHTLDTLKPISNDSLLKNIIDPFTGKPYNGMLLMGPWAFMDLLNNNNRYYNEENYIPYLEYLRKTIMSPRGNFGTLEHPEKFATNTKEVSHKLIDIWYDKSTKTVYGILMVLNTPNGLIVQEIYKSGGQLGVSCRSGGKEHKNADGTFTSEISLMITYDIVMHPGFTDALGNVILDQNKFMNDGFVNLNESHTISENGIYMKDGLFSFKTFKDGSIEDNLITNLNESANIEPPKNKKLSKQDKVQEKQDADILEEGKPSNKNSIENELENAVDTELKQQQQESMINSMNQSTSLLKKKLGGNYYDDSSAFKTTGLDLPILNNQVSTESPSV